jgi:hypothetical protein
MVVKNCPETAENSREVWYSPSFEIILSFYHAMFSDSLTKLPHPLLPHTGLTDSSTKTPIGSL